MKLKQRILFLTVAGVVAVSGAGDTLAQRGRVAAARVSRARSGQLAVPHTLPSNYGSLQRASTREVSRTYDQAHIQPVPESGAGTTYRGGDVEWRTAPDGRTVVRGETAEGRSYGGVQSADGERAAAVKTHEGDVLVRDREGEQAAYREVGDEWKQIEYDDVPYYYDDHHWYYPYYYGGNVYYNEVYPPAGATVDELPDGAEVVELDGREYILWDGVYYVKVDGHYKVVDPPEDGTAGADPIGILRGMNTFLGGQQTLVVHTDELLAEPVADGQFKTVKLQRAFALERPDKLRARRRDGEVATQFWYDGKQATLYNAAQRFYGQVTFSGELPALLDMLERDYAVTLPLSDLFQPGLADSLQPRLKESRYVGREKLGDYDCHHIALKTGDVEGDLWIDATESAPYPRKVVLRYPGTPGKPAYEATLTDWKVGHEFAKGTFEFAAPKGAKRIDMIPVFQSFR